MAAPELLESADEDGFTPLHLAVIQGNISLVNLLLANQTDVNALDNEGHSVVHWATVCGEIEALRAVLMAGADVSTPDINGGSPLHYAAQMCGANYDGKSGQNSSSKLALEILNILLAHPKSSVEVIDKDGRQPLLWAASAGSEAAVLAIIKAGARAESADKDGLTALHCAASRGHTGCIDTLISLCGAPTDLIDSNGCTALHYAVTLGHADATSLLLDLDADPNRQDRKGRTPAHCGCAKGQFETVKILGARNANLWLRNARGDLPVHEAASSGRRELVQWLLEQRPKQVNTTSNDGRTLLHIAAGNDMTDMCKMLIDFGADVNSIYRTMRNVVLTPLDSALLKGYRSIGKFLQLHGGLPASKLRLSGRKQNALNDQELVTLLKFPDKLGSGGNLEGGVNSGEVKGGEVQEDTHKHYVVYVKRSDSEESDNEMKGKGSKRNKMQKKCHRKSRSTECSHHRRSRKQGSRSEERRRTSSCSDTFLVEREERAREEGYMNRSKSNLEMRCSKKSREPCCSRSSSSSSSSSSGTSSSDEEVASSDDEYGNDKATGECETECCKHARKKHKHNKYCKRYSVSVKKYKGSEKEGREREGREKEGREKDVKKSKLKKSTKSKKSAKSNTKSAAQTGDNKGVQMADKDTQSVDFEQEKSENMVQGMQEKIEDDSKSKENIPKSESYPSTHKSRPMSSKKRPQSARISSAQKKQQTPIDVDDEPDADLLLIESSQQVPEPVISLNEILESSAMKPAEESPSISFNPASFGVADESQEEHEHGSFAKLIDTEAEVHQFPGSPSKELQNLCVARGGGGVGNEDEQQDDGAQSDGTFTLDRPDEHQHHHQHHPEESQKVISHRNAQEGMGESSKSEIVERRSDESSAIKGGGADGIRGEQGDAVVVVEGRPDGEADEEEKFKRDEMRQEIIDKPQTPIKPPPTSADDYKGAAANPPNSAEAQEVAQQRQDEILSEDNKQSAFSVLQMSEQQPQDTECTNYDQGIDPSFMVLDKEESSNVTCRNMTPDRNQKRPASFKVLGESRAIEENLSTDEDQNKDEANGLRRKKLKKRTKTKDSLDKTDEEGALIEDGTMQQLSRDQDSGFEPSPRTLKSSKIPAPKAINHDQSLDQSGRKDGFSILDDRKVVVVPSSSRAEGRKPGDQNACNMNTVNQSIQRNIRRYYMERKIFQHLLELKSLQIRSSKVNEAVLVKRAVDDYHKSVQALGYETGGTLRRYPNKEFTFKNFEIFLYETLKSLQKNGTYNFQNISDVYKEAERRLSPDYKQYEKALQCTTKTHRCLHAAHAYTGIPCAAYIPMMNHHTIPKLGFGPYKTSGVGSFYLPKILTSGSSKCRGGKVSLELSHGNNKQLIPLPSEKLDSNKRYYVTFTVKGNEPNSGNKPENMKL